MENDLNDLKLVAEYMNHKWKAVKACWSQHSHYSYNVRFDREAQCQLFCDKINEFAKSENEKYEPLPEYLVFTFHEDWNKLIPVWSKAIKELCELKLFSKHIELTQYMTTATWENDIQSAFATTVKAIKFIKGKK